MGFKRISYRLTRDAVQRFINFITDDGFDAAGDIPANFDIAAVIIIKNRDCSRWLIMTCFIMIKGQCR